MSAEPPSRPRLLLGIDPGTHTGLALFDVDEGRLTRCGSLPFWEAAEAVTELSAEIAAVVLEDARRIGIYAKHSQLHGARRDRAARSVGMIDRDVQLWLDLCERLGLPVMTAEPTRKKWDAETFRNITGWEGRTNEHARDAGRLVFGRSISQTLLLANHSTPTGAPRHHG